MELLNQGLRILIARRELGKAEKTIRSRSHLERAYILLFIATLREMLRQESPIYFEGLDSPESLTRNELKNLFFYFRNMRDVSERKLEEIDRMLEFAKTSMPKGDRLHMIYSIDSLNILLATLSRGILGANADYRCRDIWLELKRSHQSLKEAMSMFAHTISKQNSGSMPHSSMPFSDSDSWLEAATWIPNNYRL